jgi:D-sedoheptulose 7-phosphate isomerase
MQSIRDRITEQISVLTAILEDADLVSTIQALSAEMGSSLRNGGKILFCGNGGSAADAQHLAAELSGRFYYDRDPLDAEALHVNTSYLTAVANDYSYDDIFVRLVKAKGRKGDVLVGLSTSGNSRNVIKAVDFANAMGMITAGLTGATGGLLKDKCAYLIRVPSQNTPRIQEGHILIGHIICERVESDLFPNPMKAE